MQIIKAIESMNQWTSQVMTSWVEYHTHRFVLLTIIPLLRLRDPSLLDRSQSFSRAVYQIYKKNAVFVEGGIPKKAPAPQSIGVPTLDVQENW